MTFLLFNKNQKINQKNHVFSFFWQKQHFNNKYNNNNNKYKYNNFISQIISQNNFFYKLKNLSVFFIKQQKQTIKKLKLKSKKL